MISQQSNRRFGGIIQLYGADGFECIQAAHVAVIGVGGVGSWVVEALARSGVGKLTLVDMDHVTESNINRQLPALDSTLGMAKVLALQARVLDINPECLVKPIEEFITLDNHADLISDCGLVADCIDHAHTKAALIAWCRHNKKPLITVGGAGGKTDPSRIQISDLSRTKQDPLLARTRKTLRQHYRFSRNTKRRFGVAAVFSDEPTHLEDTSDKPSHLNCGGLGSVTHVTAGFGMLAAAKVLDRLANRL